MNVCDLLLLTSELILVRRHRFTASLTRQIRRLCVCVRQLNNSSSVYWCVIIFLCIVLPFSFCSQIPNIVVPKLSRLCQCVHRIGVCFHPYDSRNSINTPVVVPRTFLHWIQRTAQNSNYIMPFLTLTTKVAFNYIFFFWDCMTMVLNWKIMVVVSLNCAVDMYVNVYIDYCHIECSIYGVRHHRFFFCMSPFNWFVLNIGYSRNFRFARSHWFFSVGKSTGIRR